ncbi:hypothetical protein EVAR_31226_1 [Eumeta japonica]|uniref:Uncharacterized protein n=1 Tax=Eumeta variegata TaxID=151549 RepID=A0A4C1VZU4_EUMVA|nr:hypothetical protein EVAR_31226_1 [Eumeta japonica]
MRRLEKCDLHKNEMHAMRVHAADYKYGNVLFQDWTLGTLSLFSNYVLCHRAGNIPIRAKFREVISSTGKAMRPEKQVYADVRTQHFGQSNRTKYPRALAWKSTPRTPQYLTLKLHYTHQFAYFLTCDSFSMKKV